MVFLTASSDHVTGLTGATLTLTLSKDGGAFGSVSPTVTERGDGWYSIALTAGNTDTLGDFVLHITASGADPIDLREQVFASLPGDSVTVSSLGANSITDTSLATSAITEIQSGLATAADLTAVKAKTDSLTFTVAGQVDANIPYVNDVQVVGTGAAGNEWGPL